VAQFRGMSGGFVWLLVACLPAAVTGQTLVLKDSLAAIGLPGHTDTAGSLVRFRLFQDLEYSLFFTNLLFLNRQHGTDANVVSALSHFKYQVRIAGNGNLQFTNTFSHDLGIQYFFDSITRFQPDENTLDTRAEYRIVRNLSLSLFSTATTRMFNSWQYSTSLSGKPVKVPDAAFLAPLLWTLSAGVGWNFPNAGNVTVGLSSARFTWIRNRRLYDRPDVPEFYGVAKGKNHRFEYGLSMHLLVDKDFLERIHWNCDLLLFKNYREPVDMVMKNLVGIKINKFLKTSIQTRLYYENRVSARIQAENIVSFGFSFNL
jgi:hypothetical protein